MVAGAVATDLVCGYKPGFEGASRLRLGTSNPASMSGSLGGVGQNVATAARLCGANVVLCSVVGNDDAGQSAIRTLQQRGLDVTGVHVDQKLPTARFVAFNDAQGRLETAMADMAILEQEHPDFDVLWGALVDRVRPKWIAVDGNWGAETLQEWAKAAKRYHAKVAYEPVSVDKSTRIFAKGQEHGLSFPSLDLAGPNLMELDAMTKTAPKPAAWQDFLQLVDRSSVLRKLHNCHEWPFRHLTPDVPMKALAILPCFRCLLSKARPDGVLLTEILSTNDRRLQDPSEENHIILRVCSEHTGCAGSQLSGPRPHQVQWCDDFGGVYMRHFKAAAMPDGHAVINTNGSGDTFFGVLLAGLVSAPNKTVADFVQVAQVGATLTLQSEQSVSAELVSLAAQLGK